MQQSNCRASNPLAIGLAGDPPPRGFGVASATALQKFCELALAFWFETLPTRVPFIVPVRFAVTIAHMKKIISTDQAPAAIGPYSQAVRSGNFLFCSGQIPLDPKSGEIVSGDIATQTRRVLDNIAAVLRADGLTFDNVVKTTIFLTDLGDFQTVNEIYGSYFKQDPPARSTVQVSALPKGAKIEIDAIADTGEAEQTAYDTSG
jgi:2-iminobutanoate/2-iminopropanoate deaminase